MSGVYAPLLYVVMFVYLCVHFLLAPPMRGQCYGDLLSIIIINKGPFVKVSAMCPIYNICRNDFTAKLQDSVGEEFQDFQSLDSQGRSSFMLLGDEHFSSLLELVKGYIKELNCTIIITFSSPHFRVHLVGHHRACVVRQAPQLTVLTVFLCQAPPSVWVRGEAPLPLRTGHAACALQIL